MPQPTQEQEQEQAAIVLQSAYRGHLVRNKYTLPQLANDQLTRYVVCAVGNDPIIKGLEQHQPTTGKTAVIGISGARSILIAAEISTDQAASPKIFLIDNSRNVALFWQNLKRIAQTANNPEDFLSALEHHLTIEKGKAVHESSLARLEKADEMYFQSEGRHSPNLITFFQDLFAKFGFTRIQVIIAHASIIKQTWENSTLFERIANHIKYLGITHTVVYASNIIQYMAQAFDPTIIIRNIGRLQPALSIHTDLCPEHRIPENFFLLTDSSESNVQRVLLGENDLNQTAFNIDSAIQIPDYLIPVLMANPALLSAVLQRMGVFNPATTACIEEPRPVELISQSSSKKTFFFADDSATQYLSERSQATALTRQALERAEKEAQAKGLVSRKNHY